MDKEGVTVIVPVYNTEKYLSQCIESILGQTYQNLEIFLINDSSTDGSLEILKKYEKKDTRITIIDLKQNVGQKSARNLAYEKSTKKYITNIDSDDFIEKDAIEETLKFLKENNLDISIYDMYYFYENSNKLKKQNNNKIKNNTIMTGKEAFVASIDWQINSQGIYKKEIILKYLDDLNFYNGDEVAVRRRFLNAKRVGLANKKYFYRQHENSYVNKVNVKVYQYLISNLNLREEIKKISDYEIKKKALEKFETTNMSMIINFFNRYLKEKRNFKSEERRVIEEIFNKSIDKIDKVKVFNCYIKNFKFFKCLKKFVKIKKLEKILRRENEN